jgi:hypothetical protein
LLNPGPGFCVRVDSESFSIDFYDRYARSLVIKAHIHFLLRRFYDDDLAQHVVVSTAAGDRTVKLKSANLVRGKVHVDSLLRGDSLIDAKCLELKSVIDVLGSNDQSYGFPFCTVIVRGLNSNCFAVTLISTGGEVLWVCESADVPSSISQSNESSMKTKDCFLRSNEVFAIDNFSWNLINQYSTTISSFR